MPLFMSNGNDLTLGTTHLTDLQVLRGTMPEIEQLHQLLTSQLVQSLLCIHPNEIAAKEASTPQEWQQWHSWAGETSSGWLNLVDYYMTGNRKLSSIPVSLQELLDEIRRLQLSRLPIALGLVVPIKATGMSPKKAHEVSRMVSYILEIIRLNGWDTSVLRIVDVGAGQGYLTRTLKAQLPQTHIMALDADEDQTAGARRWENRLFSPSSTDAPPIAHRTIHITPEALYATIDAWIAGTCFIMENKIPVLLVGLHACGSLTLDVIRTYKSHNCKLWTFAAVVVVGCCYNLMNPGDFPLSRRMKDLSPTISLPTSAYHLAAQIPTQWLSDLSPLTPVPSVELAMRKVTWRALLGRCIRRMQVDSSSQIQVNLTPGRQLPWSRLPPARIQNFDLNEVGTGAIPEMRRLGRLRDAAYKDWETFLDAAGSKMGADFRVAEGRDCSLGIMRDDSLEQTLEVVHTLRCLLGPMIESTILVDRLTWITEGLEMASASDVQQAKVSLVNLFDQATGSGRNIAIVIAPLIP